MRLLSLKIENWGPYAGVQQLDFDVSSSAPVVLVEGENERGKTSLFFALRYALYGEMRDHDDRAVKVEELANWDARDSGAEFWFGPILEFEYEGNHLELTRKHRGIIDHLDGIPVVKILESRTLLRVVGGDPFPEKDIDDTLKRVLHPDISQFFLFDGETLMRVEKVLKSDEGARFVKDSLERALGIPALRLARADVETLAEQAGAEVRKAAQAAKVSKKAANELQAAEDELSRAENDLRELLLLQAETQERLDSANAELEKVEGIKEAFYKRQEVEKRIQQGKSDLEDYEASICQILDATWWLPLGEKLSQAADEAMDALAKRTELDTRRAMLSSDYARIQSMLEVEGSRCQTCGQHLSLEAVGSLGTRAAELEALLADEPDGPSAEDLQLRARRMRTFSGAKERRVQLMELEADMRRTRLRIIDAERDYDTFTDVIKGNNMDIAALDSQAADAKENLVKISLHMSAAETRRTEALRKRKEATESIAKVSGVGGHTAHAELEVLKTLGIYLDQAVDEFREEMRKRIQSEGSQIFRQLTTEPDYAGLRIDGNYYLRIVDSNDRVVTRRSAGASQVVTMALIGALARCSVEEGPIVMDTPFARLDTGHRSRILKWSAALGSQVVLFVQSGEFERARDMEHLDGRVGRSYELRRIGPNATSIEKVTHG